MKTKIIALLLVFSLQHLLADTRENQLLYVMTLAGADGVRVVAGGATNSRNITLQNFALSIMNLGGTLFTISGTPVRFGNTELVWNGIDSTVCIEADGIKHGLVVHTSGIQGAGIVSYSQTGGAAIKAYQDTHADSSALWVGRSVVNGLNPLVSGNAPLISGQQPSTFAGALMRLTGSGTFQINNDGSIQIGMGSVPATHSSAGNAGQIAWDANYFYVCIGTNSWKRTTLSSW